MPNPYRDPVIASLNREFHEWGRRRRMAFEEFDQKSVWNVLGWWKAGKRHSHACEAQDETHARLIKAIEQFYKENPKSL